MYIKLKDGKPEKYLVEQLRRDNPNTSFPKNLSNDLLADWGVFPVITTTAPEFDLLTQYCKEVEPLEIAGKWTQVWQVANKDQKEIENSIINYNANQKELRMSDYSQYADPLYFKYKRNESTEQEWLNKIQEIKNKYPYVE